MNCPQCGKTLTPGSRFCPYCGATLAEAGQPAARPPAAPLPPQAYLPSPPGLPGSGPGTPPPPRKKGMSRGWKIALIAILAVVVVAGAAGGILCGVVFKVVKAPVDATNRYIRAVNEGRAQEAWDLLASDSPIKEDTDFNSFKNDIVVTNEGALTTWNAHQVDVSGSTADVGVDMDFTDGSSEAYTFQLKKVNGKWLIYNHYSTGS